MGSVNFPSSSTNEISQSLINLFCKKTNGFNVVHFNARSLNSETIDYIRNVFQNSSVDIICITETWLHSDISDSHVNISGYNLLRKDRKGDKRGGGVAIYYKRYLQVKIINDMILNLIETLNLEIKTRSSKILVSCVYNPSKSYDLSHFFHAIADLSICYDYIICCGDFNVNLLSSETATTNIMDLLSLAALSVVNSTVPTRFCNNAAPSLLDYFIVSDLTKVLFFNQIDFVSDHDLIFCSFDLILVKQLPPESYQFRNFYNINYDALFSDAMQIPRDNCWFFSNVDEKLLFFVNCLKNLFDTHVPLCESRAVSRSCPWFTENVKQAIKKRSILYSRWKRNPSPANWDMYKRARNNANKITRNTKIFYCRSKLNSSLPPKILWRNLRKFGICDNRNSNCDIDPNDLNNYFISACNSVSVCHDNNNVNINVTAQFEFSVVSEVDVLRKINSIRTNATGSDGIPIKFLKIILPYIIAPITHIINFCIASSTFPSMWKDAIVTPIEKKSNCSGIQDYRPISILPVLSKVIESLMADQIVEYFEQNRLLHPMQSAFRASHSCTTANIKVFDDIRISFDNKLLTLLCFLDFTKAFDSVDHKILVKKLKLYGFCDSSAKLIISYLSDRIQRVKIGNRLSDYQFITSGVPQGSVLGPILFTIFLNDIFTVCKYVNVHAYADDIQLYISRPIGLTEDLCACLNEDLCRIYHWSEVNGICLNPIKSFVMPISKFNIEADGLPSITLGNINLSYVSKTKSLGIIINSKLDALDHINSVVKKIYFVLRNLRFSANFTPQDTRIKLVKQLILPYIDYFAHIYCNLDSLSLHKLTIALNNSARYAFSLKRFDHISNQTKTILGCTLQTYLNVRNCLLIHKLILSKSPAYLYDKFQFCRSNRNKNMIIPVHNYLNSRRLFFISAVKVWNSLPNSVRALGDSGRFKAEVTHFLIHSQG